MRCYFTVSIAATTTDVNNNYADSISKNDKEFRLLIAPLFITLFAPFVSFTSVKFGDCVCCTIEAKETKFFIQ